MKKIRLDALLVERGYFPDRDAALRAVMAGEVKVGDVRAQSAAYLVSPDADINVRKKKRFVSRGGDKLQAALDAFQVDVQGKRCLDIGSSTGGFTDCLLKAGACGVTCVDVNYGQLAWEVRTDPRVTVFERTNIRKADSVRLGAPFDMLVIDVSFIGLAKLAPVLAQYAKKGTALIALVKPQFESAPGEALGGVVVDAAVRARTVEEVEEALQAEGFHIEGALECPVHGPAGNIEQLVYAVMA